jgi:hypothetical protein
VIAHAKVLIPANTVKTSRRHGLGEQAATNLTCLGLALAGAFFADAPSATVFDPLPHFVRNEADDIALERPVYEPDRSTEEDDGVSAGVTA